MIAGFGKFNQFSFRLFVLMKNLFFIFRGERIVTVNCIGDTVLTLTKHSPTYPQQYNIDCVEQYRTQLIGELNDSIPEDLLVRIYMPAKSLIAIYGMPRYKFEHSVLREDISDRRVCIAYREFTKTLFNLNQYFK